MHRCNRKEKSERLSAQENKVYTPCCSLSQDLMDDQGLSQDQGRIVNNDHSEEWRRRISGDPGDPTYKMAVKYSEYLDIIHAIEEARNNIPREYDLGIWNNIQYGARYPKDAERSTYGHIKSRFVYEVAINLHFV